MRRVALFGEVLRHGIRKFVRPEAWPYRVASGILDAYFVVFKEGLQTYNTLRKLKNQWGAGEEADPLPIAFSNLMHPLLVRPGKPDVSSVIQNVVRKQLGQFASPAVPSLLVDAGAYIGDSTVYFLSRFENLKAIALEPNPHSYRIARRNLAPYGDRVTLLKSALCTHDGWIRFGGTFTGACISRRDGRYEVQCVSLENILKRVGSRISIFKIDIEGAERALFENNPEYWLKFVDLLLIEIHGSSNLELISSVLRKAGFSMKKIHSIYYCQPTTVELPKHKLLRR